MAKRRQDDSPLVYSSEVGRVRPSSGKPEPVDPGDGIVRVRREVKGRRGKTVTTLSGIPLQDDALRKLASQLKHLCGTGGSVKDGIIIIQGDHRDIVLAELQKQGYTVKKAGG